MARSATACPRSAVRDDGRSRAACGLRASHDRSTRATGGDRRRRGWLGANGSSRAWNRSTARIVGLFRRSCRNDRAQALVGGDDRWQNLLYLQYWAVVRTDRSTAGDLDAARAAGQGTCNGIACRDLRPAARIVTERLALRQRFQRSGGSALPPRRLRTRRRLPNDFV